MIFFVICELNYFDKMSIFKDIRMLAKATVNLSGYIDTEAAEKNILTKNLCPTFNKSNTFQNITPKNLIRCLQRKQE